MIKYAIARMIIRHYSRKTDAAKYRGMRKWEERMVAKYVKLPRKCVVVPEDAGGVPSEWVGWEGADAGRIILYFHGGGYVLCSPKTHRDLACRLARTCAARVLSVDYRLAPEHPHPAAVDDAISAYRWLLESGINPSRIAVMGDSAGGGLTLALLQKLRDRKLTLPACAVCMSPWADLTCSGSSMKENARRDPMLPPRVVADFARHYAAEKDLSLPSISPLFGDFAGLPPLLIHVGMDEVLLDDSRRVAEKASAAGVAVELKIWPKMIHVFQAMAFMLPQARQSIREIGEFIERHIP
ncbi:MAG: alpha/beta hydrolase [Spirochaetes bacterium]|nr:alpha/beta hydrolase [Spirochaetota bacterium]